MPPVYFWIRTMRAGLYSLISLALLPACTEKPADRLSVGSRFGGVFNLNETEAIRSIFPLTLTQASAFRIMAQVYQGLVAFDPGTMEVVPCLAERWEVDATATRYTFHLRKGVRFHDDPAFPDGKGRELTADDVVRCLTAICTQGIGDQMIWLFQDKVQGANGHYAATKGGTPLPQGVEGIKKIDDSTVSITLNHPSANFLQIIAHQGCWIWPQELTSAYGDALGAHAIGTGPFRLHEVVPGQAMVLERNPGYWKSDAEGRALPYLDAIRVTFAEDRNTEFNSFLKGHVTALLELPVDRLRDLKDSVDVSTGEKRFTMLANPALISQFYGFDRFHPPFNDVRVRKAFALAIDRHELVDSILGGFATVALHGIVAPGLDGYPYELIPGVPFAPDSARRLLAEAGFPGGRGFPVMQLQVNADGFGYVRVAEAVQTMIQRELNVPISISVLPADKHYERVEMVKARIWREGWTADHPDPENFLALLYGKNAVQDTTLPASINNTRFQNKAFDELFAKASRSTDKHERMVGLAEAERVAMAEMPVAPLYHEQAVFIMRPWVRDLRINAIEHLDLQAVWFDKELKQAP